MTESIAQLRAGIKHEDPGFYANGIPGVPPGGGDEGLKLDGSEPLVLVWRRSGGQDARAPSQAATLRRLA